MTVPLHSPYQSLVEGEALWGLERAFEDKNHD